MTMLDLSRKHDRATELRAIADGRLMLHVRNGVTVPRSMLAMIADEFEAMSTALAAKDAELAAANYAWRAMKDRAHAAEAQLAEANKALEEIADAKTELTNRHDYSRGWNDALFRVRQIARRAREAHGGENV